MRARKSSKARETVGTGAGASAATILMWAASLVGIELPPMVAVSIGGVITSIVSAAVRKYMHP